MGLSETQLVPSCDVHNVFVMQYNTNYADDFRLFIPHVGSFYSPTWGYQKRNSYRVARTPRLQEETQPLLSLYNNRESVEQYISNQLTISIRS